LRLSLKLNTREANFLDLRTSFQRLRQLIYKEI
jgi:hypothetical protein